MVKSVIREHSWLPKEIGSLFIDNQDYEGLEYWYDDLKELESKLKLPKKK